MPAAPKGCSICSHPKRGEIERAHASGADDLETAQHYEVSKAAIRRHAGHVTAAEEAEASATPRPAVAAVIPLRPATPSPAPLPPACPICAHTKRSEIDVAIVAGEVRSKVARRFLVDAASLKAHAECAKPLDNGVTLRAPAGEDTKARFERLARMVEEQLTKACADDEARWSAKAQMFTAAKGCLELLAKLTGEIGPEREIVIIESPRWKRIEQAIAKALAPHPVAAKAVASALAELEAA